MGYGISDMASEYLEHNNIWEIYWDCAYSLGRAITREQTIEALGEDVVEHIMYLEVEDGDIDIDGFDFLYGIEKDRIDFYRRQVDEMMKSLKKYLPDRINDKE